MDHVYLRHLSTEYRSILSADMPTDSRPISRPILGRYVGRDSADISTDVNGHACRPTPGRYFTATRPTVGRYITDTRRIMYFYIDRVSVDTIGRYVDRQSADIPTDIRPICRPRLGRHIDRHQPTRMSADTRPILHRHLVDTRPTLRSIGRCLAVVASPVNCDCFFQRCIVSYLSWALPHLFIPSFIRKPGNESCLSYRSIPARMKARRKKLVHV